MENIDFPELNPLQFLTKQQNQLLNISYDSPDYGLQYVKITL